MSDESLENWLLSALQQKNIVHRSQGELSMLTVVIPSYERQDFLLRQCVYWHGSGAKVLIIDGSPKPLSARIQLMLSACDDIVYKHSQANLMDRLNQASKLIQTRYTVMLGDDEFLLLSGLRRAINLLEENSELVACIGQSLQYHLSENGLKCIYGKGYDTYKYEVKQDQVQDRLNFSMKNYNAATCYAVTRSSIWGKSWGGLQKFSSAYVCELEHAFVTYIWGKLGSVDNVYWMRSSENPPKSTDDNNRSLHIDEWWASNKYRTERINFITKLSDELIDSQKFDRAKAEAIVSNAFNIYLQDAYFTANSSLIQKYRRFVVRVVKKFFTQAWVEYLKRLRFRSKPVTPKAIASGNFGSLDDLMATQTPLPFLLDKELVADLSVMERLIADFYRVRPAHS